MLKALLDDSYQIRPETINMYGKFIVIHALLALLRAAQFRGSATVLNRPNTLLSQHGWIAGQQEFRSASNSGQATPVDGMGQLLLDVAAAKTFDIALDKFKSNWAVDMAVQFLVPPSALIDADFPRTAFIFTGLRFI